MEDSKNDKMSKMTKKNLLKVTLLEAYIIKNKNVSKLKNIKNKKIFSQQNTVHIEQKLRHNKFSYDTLFYSN